MELGPRSSKGHDRRLVTNETPVAYVQEAMTKTTLTFLFTSAILIGLAAAPDAQVFSWEPDNQRDSVSNRVDRSLAQARRSVERLRSARLDAACGPLEC